MVLERRNELAEMHFCLNVSNDIHLDAPVMVSNLVSAFAFEVGQEAGRE